MSTSLPDTPFTRTLLANADAIKALAFTHGATNLRVFGSVARGDDTPESDLDLAIDVAPGIGLFGLVALETELSDLLSRHVDLAVASSLRPSVRADFERDAIQL